jgi:hypothetical protein
MSGRRDDYSDQPGSGKRRDDYDDHPRPGKRESRVPCPKCGSRYLSRGPWPWYLGTVGAILCKAMVCDDCGHEFDMYKPQAHLPSRKRNLAIVINGIGLFGILCVIGGLIAWAMYLSGAFGQ